MMDHAMDCESRHLIIGAGPVGLAVANALRRAGIAYDQIEADAGVGGNWRHGVYEPVHIISSKKTTEYADFPMPAAYPDFPSRGQMLSYLESYADHFKLRETIEFNRNVISVRPIAGDLWEAELDRGERRVYRGVIICNGHHWDPATPEYPGNFSGETIHSKQYKHPEQLRGKRVLVVGGGNSACDIACEAARVAGEAHISMRRGHWFMPKTMFGVPTVELLRPWMPLWLQRTVLRVFLGVIVGDYRRYGLQRPDHKIFETHPTINSELLHYLKHGRLTAHPGIARFEDDTVIFSDGTRVEADLIVFATGYRVSFPMLPAGLIEVKGAVPQLYGGGVHPDYKGLYAIGSLQVRYGFGPLITPYADLLARLIRAQAKMELPVGRVLRTVSQRIPSSHLVCPFRAARAIRRGRRLMPVLVAAERWLRRRNPGFQNPTALLRNLPPG